MTDCLVFEKLSVEKSITHCITTRKNGFSLPPYDSFNLSFNVGDQVDTVTRNRKLLADSMQVQEDKLLFPQQCHSGNVYVADSSTVNSDLSAIDALVCSQHNLSVGVLAADCIPILLFDPEKKVIGAVHSGWKGTVKDIAGKTIKIMQDYFGCNPCNIIGGIGPGISSLHYEVGQDVLLEFKNKQPDTLKYFSSKLPEEKYNVDLQEINKHYLLRAGLVESKIEIKRLCTYSNEKLLFSARRDGFNTGRFAAVIRLKK
jgi:YfiH family protein